MKTEVDICIENKDWEGLSKLTHKDLNKRKIAEGKHKDDEFMSYIANNTMKIRKHTKNHRYKSRGK